MDRKIRIGGGVEKIEVNDNGEFILLPVSDDGFVIRFYRLMEQIKSEAEKVPEVGKEDIADTLPAVEKVVEIEQDTKQKVDELFGEGTCRKVFGDVLPSMDMFVEFFFLILPFFEEYKQSRAKKMGKYGANRTGSSL